MSGLRYIDGVVTLKLDADACTGCRMCTQVCPHGVFAMDGATVRIVDRDACIECGACALNCAAGALSVDAGVGCAAAVIGGWLRGTEPNCDPGCGC
ncbi:MAG: mercury methylation ferredoxin HgcB [Coriobacteriia bacterium]|nr:mercury methylation ferredoxin HgcB [Coriobacteriia bacterium]